MQKSAVPQRRAPRGVETSKPIPVRFLPEERSELQAEAIADNRSLAAFTRLMALRGFSDYRRTTPKR